MDAHTLSQSLPEYPETGERAARILDWVDGFARIFYFAFLPFICVCAQAGT